MPLSSLSLNRAAGTAAAARRARGLPSRLLPSPPPCWRWPGAPRPPTLPTQDRRVRRCRRRDRFPHRRRDRRRGCRRRRRRDRAGRPDAAAGQPGARRRTPARPRRQRCRRGRSRRSATAQGLRPFADVIKDATEAKRPVHALEEGRPGLARDRARAVRQALLPHVEPQPGHRREAHLRRHDDLPRGHHAGRRVPPQVGTLVQLIAKNTKYTAKPGTPEARAVAAGFSDSLLATVAVVSQPHPERKSILIDANALFVADLPGGGDHAGARVPPAVRVRRAQFVARSRPRTAGPGDLRGDRALRAARGRCTPAPCRARRCRRRCRRCPTRCRTCAACSSASTTRWRSCPTTPMRPRVADERIGYFTTERFDFTSDVPRVPVSATSPLASGKEGSGRGAVRAEAADRVLARPHDSARRTASRSARASSSGTRRSSASATRMRSASRSQPDDADFDTSDVRPRVGALADGGEDVVRCHRPVGRRPAHGRDPRRRHRHRREQRARGAQPARRVPCRPQRGGRTRRAGPRRRASATYDDSATGEAVFGLSLLEARGELDPDSPDVERFVAAFLKDMTMHEVGHTLGLRHNFRASTVVHRGAARRPRVHARRTASPAR